MSLINDVPIELGIDIETYSGTSIKDGGVYKYVEDKDFDILMLAYAFDDEPVEIVDLASGEKLPERLLEGLASIFVRKTAHNANFEITCLKEYLKRHPEYLLEYVERKGHFIGGLTGGTSTSTWPMTFLSMWQCTMVKASMLGLPHSLDQVAKVLGVPNQKDAAGKALIRYFTMPCKPTKTNGGRIRNLPEHDLEKWEQFKQYCIKDVEVERDIRNKIAWYKIPDAEHKLWRLDQKIIDSGVRVNMDLVNAAIAMDVINREELIAEAKELTGLDNPNSVQQLTSWLNDISTKPITSLRKADIEGYRDLITDEDGLRLLDIRLELSKTSVKKYVAMVEAVGKDGRIRGLIQYYGANRTGRWAGRIVQVHNLPRIKLSHEELDMARQWVLAGDIDAIKILFGNVPDTLSQLIRTAFIPEENKELVIADFSAIEARVIAWVANEKWRLEVFDTHGKIYEASAAQMFKIPIEQIGKGSPYRQKGKVAELALGYQGGPGALITMGALDMGLTEEELPDLVAAWRNANPNIVKLWYDTNNRVLKCVETSQPQKLAKGISCRMQKGVLFIKLPSGRELSYVGAHLRENRFAKMGVAYYGMNQTTKKWEVTETYGGKLIENIVQAIARDCLAYSMTSLDSKGYELVMHVHDEVVIEQGISGKDNSPEVDALMSVEIPWAKGLNLNADSYTASYYKKD